MDPYQRQQQQQHSQGSFSYTRPSQQQQQQMEQRRLAMNPHYQQQMQMPQYAPSPEEQQFYYHHLQPHHQQGNHRSQPQPQIGYRASQQQYNFHQQPQQLQQPPLQHQPQRRRPAADPPAPVQHTESITGAPSEVGIQLSARQLELLARRQQNNTHIQPSTQRNISNMAEQQQLKPFQTRSNMSNSELHDPPAIAHEPEMAMAKMSRTNQPSPRVNKCNDLESSKESQRALLRSMLQGSSKPSGAISSNNINKAPDPNKALLKKVLNQQKSRVVPPNSSSNGSKLGEQLRERIFHNRSSTTETTPTKRVFESKTSKNVPKAAEVSKKKAEEEVPNQEDAIILPSVQSVVVRPRAEKCRPSILSERAVPKKSETYKKFMQTLQKEVSAQHTQLYASFTAAVGSHSLDLPSSDVAVKPKLDDETVEILQELNAHLKSTYSSTIECLDKSQLVNDKKYAKELKRAAKKKATPLSSPIDDAAVAESTNHGDGDNRAAPKPPKTSSEGVSTFRFSVGTTTSEDSLRDTTKQPKIGTQASASSTEEEGVVEIDSSEDDQISPSSSEDPILQTRSNTSSSEATSEASSSSHRRPQLHVEIPSSSSDIGGSEDAGMSTINNDKEVIAVVKAKTTTNGQSKSVLPRKPQTTTPVAPLVPWVGVQLRSVRDNEEQENEADLGEKRSGGGEKVPWAGVNLRPVTPSKDTRKASLVPGSEDRPIVLVDADNEFSGSMRDDPQGTASGDERGGTAHNSTTSLPAIVEPPPKSDEKSQHDRTIDEAVVAIRLKRNPGNEGMESRVIVGKNIIRKIQNETNASQAVVNWTLPRDDVEQDGMTLNMPTLKVTLILKNFKGSAKVLCFENAEDCLRFATAFYNMTDLEPTTLTYSAAPPVVEISESASEVNSDVRLESLNDEEQTVLERYRELRQTNSAKDALSETISRSPANQTAKTATSLSPEEQEQVQKYQKMLKLGMPLGAVQHRMTLDNAPSKVQDVVASETDKKNAPPSFVSALPSSPISTFTSTTVGEKTDFDKLTEDEEKIADSYRILLKRGLPAEAVRHKLTRDQVDIKIVAAIFGGSNESKPPAAPTATGPQLSEKENDIAEKYRKMLKMRIPAEGVRHKMGQDQVDAKIVAAVLGEEKAAVVPKAESNTKPPMKKKGLSAEEETIASQYRKLLKLQIPRNAVLSRMEKDDVSEHIITAVLGARALASKSSNDESTVSCSASTGSNLINLHWNAMEDVPAGSVWETSKNTTEPERSDISKLVELFQRKKTSSTRNDKKNDGSSGSGKARLLDLTRSNNIAISLKAFKDFSSKDLADIIGFLDPTRKIPGERSQFIRDLLPTAPEMKIITEYNGTDDRLVPAELWFRHLRGIKRLETKAQILRTMEMYSSEIIAVMRNLRLLSQVCHQVMASVKLQDLLGMVLRVGNVMNEGTRTGGAAGFRFDSLLRLTQTKTSDGKITVLDYLVTVFVAKGQRDTLDLSSDFPDCHTASRLLISDMTNEVNLLKDSLEQCKTELKDLARDLNPSPPPKPAKASAAGGDPRSQLFASILSRGASTDGQEELPPRPPGPRSEVFAKREQFLAVLKESKKDSSKNSNVPESSAPNMSSLPSLERESSPEKSSTKFENTLEGGMSRLRNFIENVEESYSRLEEQRNETLEACRDLTKYCGESGGVGSTITLLGVLSQFAKNIEAALKKYDQQQQSQARKQKTQEAKDIRSTSSSDSSQPPEKKESLVLLVNDVLKNANPRFKEDFKKGRMLPNPSSSLKAIYERENVATIPPKRNSDQKLDIVSAIREREGNIDDEDLQRHARSTFAGAQPVSPVPEKHNPNSQQQQKFISVKDRASQLTAAAKRSNVATPAVAKEIDPKDSNQQPQSTPVVSRSGDDSFFTPEQGKPPLEQRTFTSTASSSPPIAQSPNAEYLTRTPPLPSRPSSHASKSKSEQESERRKSLVDRARERRMVKKSSSGRSPTRRTTIGGTSHSMASTAADDSPTPGRSAREMRLQRMSK